MFAPRPDDRPDRIGPHHCRSGAATARMRVVALLCSLCACAVPRDRDVVTAGASRADAVLGSADRGPWSPRPDLDLRLPPGAAALAIDDPALPLRAWCVAVDLRRSGLEPRILLAGDTGGGALETTSAQAAAAAAVVAVNAGYFGGGRSLSLALDAGRVLSEPPAVLRRGGAEYPVARGAFGALADGALDIAWVYAAGGSLRALAEPLRNRPDAPAAADALRGDGTPWPARTAVGAGPVLVVGARTRITWAEEVFFGSGIGAADERQPRTAVGVTADGLLLLVVVQGRAAESRGATLAELARLLLDLGAVEALNLDGGGSSAMVLRGALVSGLPDGAEERPVATVLALTPRR